MSGTFRRVAWLARVLTVVLLVSGGCGRLGRRYWTPTEEERAAAERIALLHVLQQVGDQAGRPEVMTLAPDEDGRFEAPVVFTIGGTPYARYRRKYWGDRVDGVRVVVVAYYDPGQIPHWDRGPDVTGPFPAHFTVQVDLAGRRVLP